MVEGAQQNKKAPQYPFYIIIRVAALYELCAAAIIPNSSFLIPNFPLSHTGKL